MERQDRVPNALVPWLTVALVVFFVSGLAELTRPPFDMPVADSELVFGHLEYTGLRFAFFLLAEFAGVVSMSAITATLFLGGYRGYVLPDGPWWLALKTFLLAFVVIWVRATYPRMREDQLQAFAWTRLVPVSFLVILVTGFVKVGV